MFATITTAATATVAATNGWKTKTWIALYALLAVAKLFGVEIPGVDLSMIDPPSAFVQCLIAFGIYHRISRTDG